MLQHEKKNMRLSMILGSTENCERSRQDGIYPVCSIF